MNILFSPWSEYCIYPARWGGWMAKGPRPRGPIFPGQSCFMPRGFGDLSRCLILNQFFKKFNFSRRPHNVSPQNTDCESFFQKILWILLYAKLLCISGSCGRPCNSIHKKKALWQKFFIKTFLLQSSPTEPYLFTTEKSSQKYFSLQVSNSMRLTFRCNNASC